MNPVQPQISTQAASALLMVRPAEFRYSDQGAESNHFQQAPGNDEDVHAKALEEFNELVERLRMASIEVLIHDEEIDISSPDSIFPNNWFSTHNNGRVVLYPMRSWARRKEREGRALDLLASSGFKLLMRTDHSAWEDQNKFLEGTGSLVLDRIHRKAYACISPRTDRQVLEQYCSELGYDPVPFYASDNVDGERKPIYHTNVLLSIAEQYAVICTDAFDDPISMSTVMDLLRMSGKELIEISAEQMHAFAGNILQVKNTEGLPITVMSSSAYGAFTEQQLERLRAYGEVLHSPIPTIERVGGGSVRCMLAEVFLPKAIS